MDDINVRILDMDTKVPEHLVKNNDDSYTIFLNARMSRENQIASYYHALKHIIEDDFQNESVQEIEINTHNNKTPEKEGILWDYNLERVRK